MPLTQPQLWALALSGVLTELNSAHHDAIGGWGENQHTRPWCTNTLRDFYGVQSKAEFDGMTGWLMETGHSADARATLASLGPNPYADTPKQAIVRANRTRIEQSGLLAWDLGRLAAVVGWGFWAGYVDEPSAWKLLATAASRAQKAYDSWRSFGDAYELGRMFWSNGQPNEGTARALHKLFTDPKSPWNTLPWTLDLSGAQRSGGDGSAKTRFKRTQCPACGAPKTRPSQTAYVYCDFCGALADYDFQKACERPVERPGPVYENLNASLKPQLDFALSRGDVQTYRQLQMQLFDGYVSACPNAVPFRTKEPAYRRAYVAYMAEGAVVAGFDPVAKQHEAAVARAIQGLAFQTPKPGVIRVASGPFDAMCAAVFAQQEHAHMLNETRGVYAMHPDRAPGELQKRIGFSMFVQGWLPMLDEGAAKRLLDATRLGADYVEADPPKGDAASCASCGAPLTVFPGAKCVVCEHCGNKLEVGGERVSCRGCGAALAPAEGVTNFACPHCKVPMQRVQMMRPG